MLLAQRLADGVAVLGLALPAPVQDKLLDYLALLTKWNAVYNLTAVRDPEAMLSQHLLDSLSLVEPLATRLAARGDTPTVFDIGSGGGLPGIPLAIVHPHWQLVLVEPVGKKAAFLRQAAAELGLRNLRVEQAHVEKLPSARCDAITCRAFASLADFVRGISPLLPAATGAEDPLVAAMKGVLPADEIAALPAGWSVAEALVLHVPTLDAERHLLFLQRIPSMIAQQNAGQPGDQSATRSAGPNASRSAGPNAGRSADNGGAA